MCDELHGVTRTLLVIDGLDDPPSATFRRLCKINPYEGYDRFEGQGIGCWRLKRDNILNDLTTDLLAAGDFLKGQMKSDSVSGAPGGIGGTFIYRPVYPQKPIENHSDHRVVIMDEGVVPTAIMIESVTACQLGVSESAVHKDRKVIGRQTGLVVPAKSI